MGATVPISIYWREQSGGSQPGKHNPVVLYSVLAVCRRFGGRAVSQFLYATYLQQLVHGRFQLVRVPRKRRIRSFTKLSADLGFSSSEPKSLLPSSKFRTKPACSPSVFSIYSLSAAIIAYATVGS